MRPARLSAIVADMQVPDMEYHELLDRLCSRIVEFDRGTLQGMVEAHLKGTRDHSAPLWSLLMFEAFLRNVVDGANGDSLEHLKRQELAA